MDDDLHEQVYDLHAHLRATEERPLPETANRWLGEAQAVAADADDPSVPASVVETRIGQVAYLLSQVDETGDPTADGHVTTARELADAILARLDG